MGSNGAEKPLGIPAVTGNKSLFGAVRLEGWSILWVSRWSLVLALWVGLSGCAPAPTITRLQLYRELEGAGGMNRAPIVIIPGALGSVLEKRYPGQPERKAKSVWGGVSALLTHTFDEMELSIQIKSEAELLRQPDLTGEVYSKRILGRVALPWYLRIPLKLFRGQEGEYDILVERLLELGYWYSEFGFKDQATPEVIEGVVCPGDNLFVFDYDWRRDIVAIAARLEFFLDAVVDAIEKTRDGGKDLSCSSVDGKAHCESKGPAKCEEKAGKKSLFDSASMDWKGQVHLIAHSMGGLVAKYYFAFGGQPLPDMEGDFQDNRHGRHRIDNLFLVGTPSRGSMAVLRYALKGYDDFPFNLTLNQDTSRRVLSTFPAVYQLMPFGRFQVVLGIGPDRESFWAGDLYEPSTWKKLQWGIYDPTFRPQMDRQDAANWERFLEIALKRAQRVHRALDVAETTLLKRNDLKHIYTIGGDCLPTRMAAWRDGEVVRFPEYEELAKDMKRRSMLFFPGDGRVTIRSLMALDSPDDPVVAANIPVFHCGNHADLYKDEGVQDFILTVLHRLKGREPMDNPPDARRLR